MQTANVTELCDVESPFYVENEACTPLRDKLTRDPLRYTLIRPRCAIVVRLSVGRSRSTVVDYPFLSWNRSRNTRFGRFTVFPAKFLGKLACYPLSSNIRRTSKTKISVQSVYSNAVIFLANLSFELIEQIVERTRCDAFTPI